MNLSPILFYMNFKYNFVKRLLQKSQKNKLFDGFVVLSFYRIKILFIWQNFKYLDMHKEKQIGCPLLGTNKHTHIYQICIILFICLRL